MAPHMRVSAVLTETASLSKTLSIASARQLRGRLEDERAARIERLNRVLRSVLATAGIVLLAIPLIAMMEMRGWQLETALRHIAAASGCPAARAVGLAPARVNEPGYWPWLDHDNNGVSCAKP